MEILRVNSNETNLDEVPFLLYHKKAHAGDQNKMPITYIQEVRATIKN